MNYPKKVKVIELENAPFRCAKDAVAWAKDHGVVGVMSNADTGGKGAISMLKSYVDANEDTKAFSYEINNIEVLKGNCRNASRPSDKTSMIDVAILLNGVCDVNGVPLLRLNIKG